MTCQRSIFSVSLLALSLAACGPDQSVSPGSEEPHSDVLEEVQKGVELAMLPGASSLHVRARWNGGSGWVEGDTDLQLREGLLSVVADEEGILRLRDLRMSLDDVIIDSKLLGSHIHLTDVALEQGESRVCDVSEWSDNGSHCTAWLSTNLVLDWSLMLSDGRTIPLGAQTLADIAVELEIERSEGGILAHLRVDEPGLLWSWANVIELRGLELSIAADETGPID